MENTLIKMLGLNAKEEKALPFISLFSDFKAEINDYQRAKLKRIFKFVSKVYSVFNNYNCYADVRISKEAWFMKKRMSGFYTRHLSIVNIWNDARKLKIDNNKIYTVRFAGICEGISEAGCGIILNDHLGCEIWKNYYFIETCTLPQAEYTALIYSLIISLLFNIRKLIIKGTNKIVMYQLLGYYEVKDPYLKIMFNECVTLFKNFEGIVPTLGYPFMNKDVLRLARAGKYLKATY